MSFSFTFTSLRLDYLPKLKKLPRLPDSLKDLGIMVCEALVMISMEDVELIRSLFNERVSQIEPYCSTSGGDT